LHTLSASLVYPIKWPEDFYLEMSILGYMPQTFLGTTCDLTCHYPHSSDVRAILLLDPDHYEARRLLILIHSKNPAGTGSASSCHTQRPHHISNEIWWEIVSFLPRRDLGALFPYHMHYLRSTNIFDVKVMVPCIDRG